MTIACSGSECSSGCRVEGRCGAVRGESAAVRLWLRRRRLHIYTNAYAWRGHVVFLYSTSQLVGVSDAGLASGVSCVMAMVGLTRNWTSTRGWTRPGFLWLHVLLERRFDHALVAAALETAQRSCPCGQLLTAPLMSVWTRVYFARPADGSGLTAESLGGLELGRVFFTRRGTFAQCFPV